MQAVNSKIHVSGLFLTGFTAALAQGYLSLQESYDCLLVEALLFWLFAGFDEFTVIQGVFKYFFLESAYSWGYTSTVLKGGPWLPPVQTREMTLLDDAPCIDHPNSAILNSPIDPRSSFSDSVSLWITLNDSKKGLLLVRMERKMTSLLQNLCLQYATMFSKI